VRENVRAQLRVLVKRILRKHGYPPDKRVAAAGRRDTGKKVWLGLG
jgi:hypothetical protein